MRCRATRHVLRRHSFNAHNEAPSDAVRPKAKGKVELPLHIRWSGPPVTYDLTDRGDRARVYEQVLREGTADDVRFYVEADELRELFDELVLPPTVWRPWAAWLRRHR